MYFWNRQIEQRGTATFLRFEQGCFSDPDKCRDVFADVYGTDLRKAVEDFQADVRLGQVVPPRRSGS